MIYSLPLPGQINMIIKDSGPQQEKKDKSGKIISYNRTLTFIGGSITRYEFLCGVDLEKKNVKVSLRNNPWYGHIGILVDGKWLQNAEEPKWRLQNKHGVVDFKWNDERFGTIRLRAVIRPGDDKVLWELKILNGGQKDSKLQISTCAFPGQFGNQENDPPNDRWVSTGVHAICHDQERAVLDLSKEWWMYCFDANGNKRGSCAMMIVPEQCESAEVGYLKSNYGVYPGAVGKKGQKSLRFILWSFSEYYKPRDSVYKYLLKHGSELLKELKEFDFEAYNTKE
jgi:hypothetical protein